MTQEDGVDPFHLLSEEAWLKVFKYLDSDPRNMINVGATCTKFQNLLEEKKVAGRDAGQGACRLEEVVPLLLKWVPKTEALHLRLSCQRVHQLVDTLIDENKRITDYENLGLVPRLMPPHRLNLTWPSESSYEYRKFKIHSYEMGKTIASLDDIEKMEDKLKEIQIVGKSVTIIVPSSKEENLLREFAKTSPPGTIQCPPGWDGARLVDYSILHQRNFLDKIIQLFTEFPQNFKYVDIISSQMTTYKVFHTYFRRIMESLPNLCHLKIDFDRTFFPEVNVTADIPFTPLPSSNNLELLSIQRYTLPQVFLHQVAAKYGSSLKTLEMEAASNIRHITSGTIWSEELHDRHFQCEFPALMDLTINGLDEDSLTPITLTNAPQLKFLQLESSFKQTRPITVDHLSRIIFQFPSVKFFGIDVIPKIVEHPTVVLKSLEDIKGRHQNILFIALHGPVFASNLPLRFFAVLCPKANIIGVVASDLKDDTQDEDLKLLRDGRSQESKIWTDAPDLALVQLVDSSNSGSGPFISHRPEED